jgi:hypothetical protein
MKKGGEMIRNTKKPEQDDRHHPRDGKYLWRRGDGGCGKSPDVARFPLSIADEGAEVTLPLNPAPKFFCFHHKRYYKRW